MYHGKILQAVKDGLGQAKTMIQSKVDYFNE